MDAGPCWHDSVGMIWDSNFCPFRRKQHFRQGNKSFSDTARTAPVRYLRNFGIAEGGSRNLPCRSYVLLQSTHPMCERLWFVIQCTHILPQHICDLGNSQSCGCALGNAVCRRQGRLLCWVNTAPWAAAVLVVVYLVTKQSSALFLP